MPTIPIHQAIAEARQLAAVARSSREHRALADAVERLAAVVERLCWLRDPDCARLVVIEVPESAILRQPSTESP